MKAIKVCSKFISLTFHFRDTYTVLLFNTDHLICTFSQINLNWSSIYKIVLEISTTPHGGWWGLIGRQLALMLWKDSYSVFIFLNLKTFWVKCNLEVGYSQESNWIPQMLSWLGRWSCRRLLAFTQTYSAHFVKTR